MPKLEGKTAVVYGAAGWVGRAVAGAFADAGARVALAGRTEEPLAAVARDLGPAAAGYAVLDVRDAAAVADHVQAVVEKTGGIDIAFNAVTYDDVQGSSLADLGLDVFADRIGNTVAAQYAVAQAAARHMIGQGRGLISTITGWGHPYPGMGTTVVSWTLVEAMLRQWAADLGPHGVRVCWLRTGGFRESTLAARDYGSSYAGDTDAEGVLAEIEAATMLGRVPSIAEAGRAAVYLASADGLTASALNLTAGAMSD